MKKLFIFSLNKHREPYFCTKLETCNGGVNFKIKLLETTLNGNFKGFSGILKFDPTDLSNSTNETRFNHFCVSPNSIKRRFQYAIIIWTCLVEYCSQIN